MAAPHERLPKPPYKITSFSRGPTCLEREMRLSSPQFTEFRMVMDRSMWAHLDCSKRLTAQDPAAIKRHYRQARHTWKTSSMYKDRWPIAVYTGLWFRFYVRSSRPMQIHGPPRINHVVRHRDAYEAYSDAGDNASPEPEPQGRGDSAADGQGVRNKGHNSEAISGHRSPGSVSTAHVMSDAGRQVSQVNVGRSSGSNTGTTAASSPCAVRKQNGDFDPVLRFLRSLTPSLEHLGPQFRLAGIRDVERLRTIATWEHPTKWLVEKARVDLFEEEVLRIALDEVRRGQRSL